MLNPILGALAQNRLGAAAAPVRNMMQMVRAAHNQQAAVSQIMARNPQLNSVLQQYGGNAQQAFYGMAQQLGVNPDEVLSLIR